MLGRFHLFVTDLVLFVLERLFIGWFVVGRYHSFVIVNDGLSLPPTFEADPKRERERVQEVGQKPPCCL